MSTRKRDKRSSQWSDARGLIASNTNTDLADLRVQEKRRREAKFGALLARAEPERPSLSAMQAGAQAMVTEPVPALSEVVRDITQKGGNGVISRPPWQHRLLHALTLGVAIVLAGFAAYFSIAGMERIFPGAGVMVVGMAGSMEGGKLIGAAFLSRNWWDISWFLRLVLTALLAILAIINAIGVYGQLSAAHLTPHAEAIATTNTAAAENQTHIDAKAVQIADLTGRIGQIDAAIAEATKRGRTTAAMDLLTAWSAKRDAYVAARETAERELALLKAGQARIAGDKSKATADIGVLEYAAALVGMDRERMVQYLILAMVLSCDPLSITLVIATGIATARWRGRNGNQDRDEGTARA